MNQLHSLLKRQLRRFAQETIPLVEGRTDFLRAINEAYWQFDEDRRMLEHSLELTSQELLEKNAELSRINTELEGRVAARTVELSSSEARFRGLFEHAPISIWEEDFSAVRRSIEQLRAAGVVDLSAYFDEHPEELARLTTQVKIVDVNRATLEMYQTESKAGLLADLSKVLGSESLIPFKQELLALARGETSFENETINYTLRGERRAVFLRLTVAPGYEQTWAKVFIGISDITARRQAEAKLEESETLFRALFDLSPDAIILIDPHDPDVSWPIIDCNVAACLMNGYERAELIGHSIDILNLTPGPAEERLAYMKQLREAGNLNLEAYHRRKDGLIFPVEVSTTLISVGGRELVIGIDRDITERRQSEATLAAERDLLQILMDNIPDTIYFKDTASRFTRINRAQARVLGISDPEEAIGKTDLDFQDPALAQSFYDEEQRLVQTGQSLINRLEFNPTADGQPRWFSATKVPIKDEAGRVTGIVGISRDLTVRKQAEEALRKSEERFKLMAWATKDAMWDWDLRTNEIWWGEGLQKVFHYSSETTPPDPEWRQEHIHPDDRAKVNRVIEQALEGGMEFWSKEYRFQRKDGTYADIMDRAYILRDETATPYRMIGAMLDITERKYMESTLLEANEQMRQVLNELQLRNKEIVLLNEMSRLLQASQTVEEAYQIIADLSNQLFPRTTGALYLLNSARTSVSAMASWGDLPAAEKMFAPNDCWGLRHGRTHPLSEDQGGLQCLHLSEPLPAVSYCLPVQIQGEILGILHVRSQHKENLEAAKFQLAYTVVEQTGMALSNLNLRAALREQSIRDPVTGLYNRRYMEEALKQHLSRVTRHLHPLGIIMIDIDHFKNFNDVHGHAAGDQILRELGKFLQSHIRGEDTACRYGGEEFILIMPDVFLEAAKSRAEQLRHAARELRVEDGGQSFAGITLSIGVALYPLHGRTIENVLRAADSALYRAKQEGRDRVVIAESMR
jgi:diguanylate cyclase (GGDEF)-like protein/PAS domain S-box-containing protein